MSMLSYPPLGVVYVKQKVHPTILPAMDRCTPDNFVVCIALPTKSLKL